MISLYLYIVEPPQIPSSRLFCWPLNSLFSAPSFRNGNFVKALKLSRERERRKREKTEGEGAGRDS